MRCFNGEKIDSETFIITDDYRHIIHTLHKKINDKINVISENKIYECKIIKKNSNNIECKIIKKLKEGKINNKEINIILSLFKKKQIKNTIEKLTQLGINEIFLFKSERSIINFKNNIDDKINKYKKIINEAVKQSNQIKKPKITYIKDIKKFKIDGMKIVFNLSENNNYIFKKISLSKYNKITYVIGPEGGFSSSEIKMFKEINYKSFSLGNTILKCETAAIVGFSYIKILLNIK